MIEPAPNMDVLGRVEDRARSLGAWFCRLTQDGRLPEDVEGPADVLAWAKPQIFDLSEPVMRVGGPTSHAIAVLNASNGGALLVAAPKRAPDGMNDISSGVISVLAESLNDSVSSSLLEHEYGVFAMHLDHSYEATTMLYELARTLGNVRASAQFVTDSLGSLRRVLGCRWSALDLVEGWTVGGIEVPQLTVSADEARLISRVAAELPNIVSEWAPRARRGICVGFNALEADELIVKDVRLDGERAGWIVLGKSLDETEEKASSYDTQAVEIVAGLMLESLCLFRQQERTYMGSLQALTGTLEAKDPYTRGHSERVALLARMLAEAVEMDPADIERIDLCGRLHDIGKIGVPDRVLCKPDRLTDEEFEMIKQHPRIGFEILDSIPGLAGILPGVLHHHERWDGRGYPDGLEGEAIPMIARVLALADTFDAMSSNRAYRPSRPRNVVLAEFRKCAGTQFAPDLVEPFLDIDFARFDEMQREHASGEFGNQRVERAA